MPALTRRSIRCSTIHPEAVDWVRRVGLVGGGVSPGTVGIVSRFCYSADRGGWRGRFVRFNPFAGTGLVSSLVPLYFSRSFGAPAVGNATDTNPGGVFGAADYAESSGLVGNGSSKFLQTGVAASQFTATDSHQSASLVTAESLTNYRCLLGATDGSNFGVEMYCRRAGAGDLACCVGSALTPSNRFGDNTTTATLAVGHIVASNQTMYRNGAASGTVATATVANSAGGINVFCANANGTNNNFTSARVSSYSLGLGMTAAQVSLFTDAHQALHRALGRP